MKADVSGLAHSGKAAVKQPAFPHLAPAAKTLELRKSSSRHPARRHSPVATEVREIGLMLHEILALADIMCEAYGNGDMERLRNRIPLLLSKAAALESALPNVMEKQSVVTERADADCKRFDIVALLQETCEAARLTLKHKPVTVADVSCPGPVSVLADPLMIKQIIMCLMSNAAKFTERGRIAVILSRDDDRMRLTVADTGKGMAPEQISAVLKQSDRGFDVSTNGRAPSGHGLGVVKTLLKKLGGGISISSKLGEGTIVEVCLPIALLQ